MQIIMIVFLVLVLLLFRVFKHWPKKYDHKGFDKKGIHKNGTRYDDSGYNYAGYDRNGYDRQGYDAEGFDCSGYCRAGYNRDGKNSKGQYNRFYDLNYSQDGFYNYKRYPLGVSTHARQRMTERMNIKNPRDIDKLAREAYCYGKSKRQVKKSSAALIADIEDSHKNGIVLIHRGYLYIFSEDNTLITVYKNERIPL